MTPRKTKKCGSCGRYLKPEKFSLLKKSKDGLSAYCKECNNKRWRKHYQKNKENLLAKNRKYTKEHPEAKKRWYLNYKQKQLEKAHKVEAQLEKARENLLKILTEEVK